MAGLGYFVSYGTENTSTKKMNLNFKNKFDMIICIVNVM